MTDSGIEVSRRERKKDATRTRIFKAAVQLFHEKGFEATTIDEITERADVAKGTFFNYFPRKESVLGYLSETQLAEAEEAAEELLASRGTAREKLIALLQRIASVYEDEPELSRFVVRESMRRAYTPSDSVHVHWHALLTRLVEHGRETGEFRRDIASGRAVYVLASVYMGTVFMWLMCQRESPDCEAMTFDLQHELEARLSLVMDGLASRREA
jgi:TetR/AcrR family transcriptional regulator, cholesterol catabolism regulator